MSKGRRLTKFGTLRTNIRSLLGQARSGLDELRQKIDRLKAEREEIASAPQTLDESLANLDRMIKAKAASFDPGIGGLIGPEATGGGVFTLIPVPTEQREAFYCAMFGDRIRDFYADRIEEHLDGLELLTQEQRAKRLAELDKEILALEREEEAMILEAAEMGLDVARRADADPAAVLGMQD